jgi:hypothetical protein
LSKKKEKRRERTSSSIFTFDSLNRRLLLPLGRRHLLLPRNWTRRRIQRLLEPPLEPWLLVLMALQLALLLLTLALTALLFFFVLATLRSSRLVFRSSSAGRSRRRLGSGRRSDGAVLLLDGVTGRSEGDGGTVGGDGVGRSGGRGGGSDGGSEVERRGVRVGLGSRRFGVVVVLVGGGLLVVVVVVTVGGRLLLRLVLALLFLNRRTLLLRLELVLLIRNVAGSANSGGNGSGAIEGLRSSNCGRRGRSVKEDRGESRERTVDLNV